MSTTKKATKKQGGRVTPKKVTTAAEWAASSDAKGRPLEVPSGKVCLVRKPDGLKAFMDKGKIPNILLPILLEALDGKKIDETDMKELFQDPDKIQEMMSLADVAVINCVMEPQVHAVPVDEETGEVIPPHKRDEDDKLYVDYIQDEDKWFIFRWVMAGQSDLESFREELASNVATLQSGEGMGEDS